MQMQYFHFSRFRPRDKRRAAVPFIKCRGVCEFVCQCAFIHKRVCMCLFVKFEMRGDRRETGGEVV